MGVIVSSASLSNDELAPTGYRELGLNRLTLVRFHCRCVRMMSSAMAVIINALDEAYSNQVTWYGPNLRRTLAELSMEQLTFSDTYEGYSAWELALHCAYWKWTIARTLSGQGDAFPYSPAEFPRLRARTTEENWMKDLQYLDEQHERLRNATQALSDAELDAPWIGEHGVIQDGSVARSIMGVAMHDAYHTARIRSMGIPGLAERRR